MSRVVVADFDNMGNCNCGKYVLIQIMTSNIVGLWVSVEKPVSRKMRRRMRTRRWRENKEEN